MVLARVTGDEPAPERIRGRLGGVGAAGLAEDRADVVRGGVLADVERAADLAVRATPCELDEDLDLTCAETVGQCPRRLHVGAELGGTASEAGKPDRLREPERETELSLRMRAVVAGVPCKEHARVVVGGVGEPGTRAEPGVERECGMEVFLRALPVAEHSGRHPR